VGLSLTGITCFDPATLHAPLKLLMRARLFRTNRWRNWSSCTELHLPMESMGITHLETQLSESPAMFVQAIGLCYKRSDDGIDPAEWRPAGADVLSSSVVNQAYRLLKKARRIRAQNQTVQSMLRTSNRGSARSPACAKNVCAGT
jgi:hypothetical protein